MNSKNKYKVCDWVELTVDLPEYNKDGIYKGMNGWVSFEPDERNEKTYLIIFDRYGSNPYIADLGIHEDHLKPLENTEESVTINDIMYAKHGGEGPLPAKYLRLLVEDEKYTKWGIHKGMSGRLWDDEIIFDTTIVNFPLSEKEGDLNIIKVNVNDFEYVEKADASENERIIRSFQNEK